MIEYNKELVKEKKCQGRVLFEQKLGQHFNMIDNVKSDKT